MKFITVLFTVILFSNILFSQNNTQLNLSEVNNISELNKIINEDLSSDSLINLITSQKYSEPKQRGLFYLTNTCTDGKEREFSVYIPESYNPNNKTPLFVYLHGGVGSKELTPDSLWFEYLNSLAWIKMADKQNYICLFPKGEYSAMWWDTVGSANILSQIRTLKQIYNIDDNRVYLNGFSDGASASFHMAMSYATDFACFNPYNGYPAVGSFTKATPTYFVNLQNSVMKAINTDIDGLYPAAKMKPAIRLAQTAGANILYRIYNGVRHRMTYINEELPKAVRFLEANPRSKFPTKIAWETVSPKQGRFNWLEITETDTLQEKEEWHKTYNIKSVRDRLSFGFRDDREFKGKGIRVSVVAGGICKEVGLKEGDIFTKLDTFNVASMKDMVAYKKQAKRGDPIRFEIMRNDTLLVFNTKFPDPEYFDIFNYKYKSGQIRGEYIANTFYIETSRIKSFSIYIHPDMVQLNQKVLVILNGKEIYNNFVKADNKFLLSNYLKNRDKELLYINIMDFEL